MVKAAVKKIHPLIIKLVEVEGREVVKFVQKRAMHQKISFFPPTVLNTCFLFFVCSVW